MDSWEQRDTWQFKAAPNSCLKAQGDSMPPYMPLIANPVTSLQLVAQAMLYNWPNVSTGCTGTGTDQDPFQLARVAPQGVGNRFMLGLVTLGDARRYGLTTAKLQASPGHYVAGDSAGIKAALALAHPGHRLRPFTLDQAEVRRSARAYPGAMLVYTAAKTYGLDHATAQDVAQFIRVSTHRGPTARAWQRTAGGGLRADHQLRSDRAALPPGAAGRGRGRRSEGASEHTRQQPGEPVVELPVRPDVAGRRAAGTAR